MQLKCVNRLLTTSYHLKSIFRCMTHSPNQISLLLCQSYVLHVITSAAAELVNHLGSKAKKLCQICMFSNFSYIPLCTNVSRLLQFGKYTLKLVLSQMEYIRNIKLQQASEEKGQTVARNSVLILGFNYLQIFSSKKKVYSFQLICLVLTDQHQYKASTLSSLVHINTCYGATLWTKSHQLIQK